MGGGINMCGGGGIWPGWTGGGCIGIAPGGGGMGIAPGGGGGGIPPCAMGGGIMVPGGGGGRTGERKEHKTVFSILRLERENSNLTCQKE